MHERLEGNRAEQAAAGKAAVETVLGAETVAEVTAEQHDEAVVAKVTGEPIMLPAFAEMTDLEMRSHLYLLHGVYALDIEPRAKITAEHAKAHDEHERGKLNARYVEHVHAEPAK